MTLKLSDELRQALAKHKGRPLQMEDPLTRARYVLVQLDVYERLEQGMDYDATEPDPREFYAPFAEAVKDDLDAPGMERYDEEALSRKQP